MTEKTTLSAEKRTRTGRKIRKDASTRIPAILYGHGRDNVTLWVEKTPFLRAFQEAGESTIIALTIGKESVNVLVHDYQVDPLSNEIIHVDFFQVRMDEAVTTDIALTFVGEAPAVKTDGGTLTTTDVITVRALPADLPHEIVVDISSLDSFDASISVADLAIDRDKVEILTAEDLTIASVVAPRTQEEVDAADDEINADISQVEGAAETEEASAETEDDASAKEQQDTVATE